MTGLNTLGGRLPAELITIVAWALALAQLIIAIVLAVAVQRDAEERKIRTNDLFLVSPLAWSFVVFLTGGYLGALGYWLIHYSVLRQRREDRA